MILKQGGLEKYSYEFIFCLLKRSSLASGDYNPSSLLSCQWKGTVFRLNICMVIISINVTDICNTVPVTELSAVQMLNHLILMPTLGGRCCYSHFTDEENDEPRVNNMLGVT